MIHIFDRFSSSTNEDNNDNTLSQTEIETFIITVQQKLDEKDPDNNYFSYVNDECFSLSRGTFNWNYE